MAHVTLTKSYMCFEVNSYNQCYHRLDIAKAIKILIFFSCYKDIYENVLQQNKLSTGEKRERQKDLIKM